jgi:hypothetical protein
MASSNLIRQALIVLCFFVAKVLCKAATDACVPQLYTDFGSGAAYAEVSLNGT